MTAIVGLTGGIASGKSTVSGMFRALGVPIVDADVIAREVVAPKSDALKEIVDAFGQEVIDANGELDRKKLGALVFADPAKRRTLEGITHPRIAARSMQALAELAQSGPLYGIYDAALLVENGTYRAMTALVVVAAQQDTQRARIIARDGLTHDEADARMAAQFPLEKKIAVADYVIWNDAGMESLAAEVAKIDQALRARFAAS